MNPGSSRRRRPLRDELREQVARAILDAAEVEIAARGLHGAALAAIARRAGVAVGTLYNYFADRDALVRALFEARRTMLVPAIRAAADGATGAKFETRLRAFVHAVLSLYDVHRRFVKVAIEAEHLKVKTPGKVPATIAELHAGIDRVLATGVADGALAADAAPLAGKLLAGMLRAVVMYRIEGNQPFADDADAVVATFLRGAPKGLGRAPKGPR